MQSARFEVKYVWSGELARPSECASVEVVIDEFLRVRVEAPYHGDPLPTTPTGAHDGLWEYEVVELFLLGAGQRYLEIELGPGGHHWVLSLCGPRRVEQAGLPARYHAERDGQRWRGEAELPLSLLPAEAYAANAYAIHGQGTARRYLAHAPVPGAAPDFHRLDQFPRLLWEEG